MTREPDRFGPLIWDALTQEPPKSDRPPLPLGWKIFCLVALAVALGEITLTVAILTIGGAP